MKNKKDLLFLLISAAIVAVDLAVKIIIRNTLAIGETKEVIRNFFYISHVENPGAAWGMLGDSRLLLLAVSFVVLAIVSSMFVKMDDKFLRISLSVVIGGAIGNMIDRIFRRTVTDFLQFYIFTYEYPSFNIADISIVVGAILIAVYIIFFFKEEKKNG